MTFMDRNTVKRNVRLILYREGDVTTKADESGINISGLRLSYETLGNLLSFFRRDGELEIKDDAIAYICNWCGEEYERGREDVCRCAPNSLPFCSRNFRSRVVSYRSTIKRVFKNLRRDECALEEIQDGFWKYQHTKISGQKMEEYLERLYIVEKTENGGYRLKEGR